MSKIQRENVKHEVVVSYAHTENACGYTQAIIKNVQVKHMRIHVFVIYSLAVIVVENINKTNKYNSIVHRINKTMTIQNRPSTIGVCVHTYTVLSIDGNSLKVDRDRCVNYLMLQLHKSSIGRKKNLGLFDLVLYFGGTLELSVLLFVCFKIARSSRYQTHRGTFYVMIFADLITVKNVTDRNRELTIIISSCT